MLTMIDEKGKFICRPATWEEAEWIACSLGLNYWEVLEPWPIQKIKGEGQ